MVSPGTQVLSLVQSDAWVQANFRETQVRTCGLALQQKFPWTPFLACI